MGPMEEFDRFKKNEKKGVLSDGTFSYYKRVHESYADGFTDENERDIFLTNVFKQLKEEATSVCQNQTVSRYIEELLINASPKHIYSLWKVLHQDWMTLCMDRCASHVLHKTILYMPLTFDLEESVFFSNREETSDYNEEDNTEDDRKWVSPRESFLEFYVFLDENLDTIITNTYGSHILRAALQVLANISVANNITRTKANGSQRDHQQWELQNSTPDVTFRKRYFKLSKRIISMDNAFSYLTDKSANPVMQILLQITPELCNEKGRKLCRKIIKLCNFFDFPPIDSETPLTCRSRLPDLMMDPVATYLVQQLLRVCPDNLYNTWYESAFKGRLIAYAVNGISSYVLHLVIERCIDQDMLDTIFGEIGPYIEDILAMNHMGVIKSLGKMCLKFGSKQKKFVNSLMDAFHCSIEGRRKCFVHLIVAMKTYEVHFDNTQFEECENPEQLTTLLPIDLHGAMLLQTILKFGDASLAVNSFLHLTRLQLVNLITDFYGQHIYKHFFESSTIGEKSKDALLKKLSGTYINIAISRHGSRAWQAIWPYLSIKYKSMVAEELCSNPNKFRNDKYGWYVFKHLALDSFMHSRREWEVSQRVNTTKRKMFADILDGNKKKKFLNEKEKLENVDDTDDGPKPVIPLDMFNFKNKKKR